jgi:hypothetical protein
MGTRRKNESKWNKKHVLKKKNSSKPIEALIPTTKLMEDDNIGKNNEMWRGGFHV